MALHRLRQISYLGRSILPHSYIRKSSLQPYYLAHIRFLSDSNNPDPKRSDEPETTKESPKDLTISDKQLYKDVPEEETVVSKFGQTELLPEVPIKSLDLVKRIDKVEKKGSFVVDLFKGSYDEDFLIYPETLDNREENKELKKQSAMVMQMYPQIWDDPRQLQKFNFFNLFQLSVTEMMTIFEAIGGSSRKCYDVELPVPQRKDFSIPQQTLVSKSIISLIIRNCLTYWPMNRSDNPKIREHLPAKHILFGGLSETNDLCPPIGFCWTEQADGLGSIPPQEWLTIGESGESMTDHYLIKGRKTRVLYEDLVENYLIYFRDKFLSSKYEEKTPEDEPNPASDPFVGCCLVPKSQLKLSQIYHDSAGCQYVDVDIDTLVSKNNIVFAAQRRDPTGVNVRALGQLATCSVVMGILKDSLKMTYKHLIDNKQGILNCDIIGRKLAVVTSRIFAIESMVYYIAGMYDGLKDGFDAHMETTILKIVTNEYAYEVMQNLQQICGSDMFIISRLQDQINMFDSFLDGNIYNRLYLATMGVIWFARSQNMHLNRLRLAPWYPGYFIKSLLKDRSEQGDFLTLNADIQGNLHPSLKDASINLEYIVKRVKYASERLCMRHGKDVTAAQSALYHLAQLSIDAFVLTTMCARASKSYCNGSRNSEIDIAMATEFSRDMVRDVRLYMEEINTMPINALFSRQGVINELNQKWGGYYAESPLDPNI